MPEKQKLENTLGFNYFALFFGLLCFIILFVINFAKDRNSINFKDFGKVKLLFISPRMDNDNPLVVQKFL